MELGYSPQKRRDIRIFLSPQKGKDENTLFTIIN
jgi:hypothetical protein